MDAGVDVIADDRAELESSGVDQLASDHRAVMRPIVAVVRGDGASTQIDFFSDEGITDKGQMSDRRVREDKRVFDFHRVANDAVIADACRTADIAIRADFAMLANDDVALDHHARQDARAVTQFEIAIDDR